MKTDIPLRVRYGRAVAVVTLICAIFMGGITSASAKDKKHKDGYWDQNGYYHQYRSDKNGYWDQYGHYHHYNEDKKKNQGNDYISKGRQIWDILSN